MQMLQMCTHMNKLQLCGAHTAVSSQLQQPVPCRVWGRFEFSCQ